MRKVDLVLGALVAVAVACHHEAVPPPPAADAGARPATSALAEAGPGADQGGDAAASSPEWAELLRQERWVEAARAIDGLPDAEKSAPEVRFARGYAAAKAGDGKTALVALAGLESSLPLLVPYVERLRAEAKATVGPFLEAAEYFDKGSSVDDALAAARAFVAAKVPKRARTACLRVLSARHRSRAAEAEARSIRMHVASKSPQETARDARWLLLHAPDLSFAKGADAALHKADPKHPLTGREELARSQVLASAGLLDGALDALDHARWAAAPKLTPLEIKRARADAMMRARTRYLPAAEIFLETSAAGGPHAADDLLSSAHAASRADKDDVAIARYAQVVRRFPHTPQAGSAIFLAARLELLHGRWTKAAAGLDDYVQHHGGGAERADALRMRAVAHLMAGDVKLARRLFEQRSASGRDALARARMANLAATAALRDGDRTHAVARWTEVARTYPLTWPALVARARLAEAKAPLPPVIDPAKEDGGAPLALQVRLPPPVDVLHRLGLDGEAEAALRAREGTVTGANPSRAVESLCRAYAEVGRGHRRLQVAQQVSASAVETAPTGASRWAWECLFPTPYAGAVDDAEMKETLPTGLVHAVMRQESGFDPDVVSPARAVGLMQLLPETGKKVAGSMGLLPGTLDLTQPGMNIALGAHYLHDLIVRAKGSVPVAVAAYNAGPSVMHWVSQMKGIELDAFVESIPFAETRGYVVRVMGNLARYAYLRSGAAGVPSLSMKL